MAEKSLSSTTNSQLYTYMHLSNFSRLQLTQHATCYQKCIKQ